MTGVLTLLVYLSINNKTYKKMKTNEDLTSILNHFQKETNKGRLTEIILNIFSDINQSFLDSDDDMQEIDSDTIYYASEQQYANLYGDLPEDFEELYDDIITTV